MRPTTSAASTTSTGFAREFSTGFASSGSASWMGSLAGSRRMLRIMAWDSLDRAIGEGVDGGGEQVAALLVVSEHVEAGAGRREQHGIAELRELRRGPDGVIHRRGDAD